MIAAFEFDEIDVYAGCKAEVRFELYRENGVTMVAIDANNDVVEFTLSTKVRGQPTTDILAVNSDDDTAHASIIEIEDAGSVHDPAQEDDTPATVLLKLTENETEAIADAWEAGVNERTYVGQLFLIDASDSNQRRICARGLVHFHRSAE